MQSQSKSELIKNLPLIPLRDLVVFPSTLVPFIIGRSSSIQALERASGQDKQIFLSAQMDASLDNPRPLDIYSMGVLAKIIRVVKMDDKNMKVIVEGKKRARIVEFLSTFPFYQVLAKELREIDSDNEKLRETLKVVLTLFEDYLKAEPAREFRFHHPGFTGKQRQPHLRHHILASFLAGGRKTESIGDDKSLRTPASA